MQSKHNKQLVSLARALRKNMTKEERRLWYDFLRDYPVRFSRQKVLGRYIADFYSAEAKLIIELDGSQHYEDENIRKDARRTPAAGFDSRGRRSARSGRYCNCQHQPHERHGRAEFQQIQHDV